MSMSMINVWNLEFAGHAISKKTHVQTGLNLPSMVHWFLFLLWEVVTGNGHHKVLVKKTILYHSKTANEH